MPPECIRAFMHCLPADRRLGYDFPRLSHKGIHIFKIIRIVLHIASDTSQALTYIAPAEASTPAIRSYMAELALRSLRTFNKKYWDII